MAIDFEAISKRNLARDGALVIVGTLLFAVGLNCFMEPNGLAPGGISGIAIIIRAAVIAQGGPDIPVGIQTLVMNALLMVLAWRAGGPRYVAKSLAGIVLCSVFIDLTAPFLPVLGNGDLLLCALWGGVVSGTGLGLVFRAGSNTGGTDIICQIIARHSMFPVGTWVIITDFMIAVASAPVFSVENALYACIATYLMGKVCDMVIDGPIRERVAWIISSEHEAIAQAVLEDLDRGCTEVTAKGKYTGEERPMLFCILSRSDIAPLKDIVAEVDSDAIVVITDAHEAFGEGFRKLEGGAPL